jgi:NTE family protein
MAFIERGGWYGADPFLVWLRRKLDSGPWKGGQRRFSALTLAQVFAETNVELSVVASDTTDNRMLVLNHRTAPDCPIVWAVRMSMSIPLVWDEVVWQPEWGSYLGRDISRRRLALELSDRAVHLRRHQRYQAHGPERRHPGSWPADR